MNFKEPEITLICNLVNCPMFIRLYGNDTNGKEARPATISILMCDCSGRGTCLWNKTINTNNTDFKRVECLCLRGVYSGNPHVWIIVVHKNSFANNYNKFLQFQETDVKMLLIIAQMLPALLTDRAQA